MQTHARACTPTIKGWMLFHTSRKGFSTSRKLSRQKATQHRLLAGMPKANAWGEKPFSEDPPPQKKYQTQVRVVFLTVATDFSPGRFVPVQQRRQGGGSILQGNVQGASSSPECLISPPGLDTPCDGSCGRRGIPSERSSFRSHRFVGFQNFLPWLVSCELMSFLFHMHNNYRPPLIYRSLQPKMPKKNIHRDEAVSNQNQRFCKEKESLKPKFY